MGTYEDAKSLDAAGINVIPAVYKDKRPAVDEWETYQQVRTSDQLELWFRGRRNRNIMVVCGTISRLLVLDLDSKAAGQWWRAQDGMDAAMDATTCVKTANGYHYWFRLDEGETFPSAASRVGDVKFDIKCEGGLVVAPASVHETGKRYEFKRGVEACQPVPEAIRRFFSEREEQQGTNVRSMFVDLLRRPPEAEGEGRNEWLARVAGHLAKWVPHEDAYHELVRYINDSLPEPMDYDDEVDKLVKSVWNGHMRRHAVQGTEPSAENGFLSGDGWQLWTPCKRGETEALDTWADFDMQVVGTVTTETERSWIVDLSRNRDQTVDRLIVEAEVVTNPQKLATWLGNHGVSIFPPKGDTGGRSKTDRLQRYLDTQDAPACTAVAHLGWHTGVGFVTHQGILTPHGLVQHDRLMPRPHLEQWAPYRYGMVERERARNVLRDVLTFHDEQVCGVFGAWWAAVWLKAQIMEQAALFPFMALEAPSESGKTTGFFSLMVQLNGNYAGHGEYTVAALRDFASAHRNGIVWVDDMSQPDAVLDLLRQVTAEGSRAKKAQDRHSQETVRLLAPVVISGEGFDALDTEKALKDRAVILGVPSPTGRMSHTNPDRPQWDDIQALRTEWGGDLTQAAGTLGGMALECEDMVPDLKGLRTGSGRWADKMAILRLGARVLARLTEQDHWIEVVDQWCAGQTDPGHNNLLTTRILPMMLLELGVPRTPNHGQPVYVDEMGIVWFHEVSVAQHWRQMAKTPREKQLGSVESIRQQRQALGILGTGHRRRTGVDKVQRRYHPLDDRVSEAVLGRLNMDIPMTPHQMTQPDPEGVT